MSERPRVLVELGVELDRAARQTLRGDGHTTARSTKGRRGWRLRAVTVVVLLLLGGAAAAVASGLISIGAPAQPTPTLSNADTGLGALKSGSVKVLPIATADPQGGPPWGLRVLTTTRGEGCVQVGRLVEGKLVALGQNGAFNDDGQAHPLPLSTAINSFSCTPLDAKGREFDSVTMLGQSASAAWWFRSTGCVPTGAPQATSRAHPACSQRDERNVYYGLLGPDATSISYDLGGRHHTQPTVGSQGAYLIVTASDHQHIPSSGGGIADDVPVYSPLTSINYRTGATCHLLTARRWIEGSRACAPAMAQPVGYAPVSAPTHAQIATTIHATIGRDRLGSQDIVVSFKSRIAITTVRGYYELEWHRPGTPPTVEGFTQMGVGPIRNDRADVDLGLAGTGSNIAVGQTVTGTILPPFGPGVPARARLAPGTTSGMVILRYSTGPSPDGAQPTANIPVGPFAITIP
jgi:hypothetical protein